MPEDYEKEDSIKLGKDLKIGDCIRSKHGSHSGGIVFRINGLPGFYKDPHYEVYDINSPMDGPYSTYLDMEAEFTVINSRKEILRYYDAVELALLSHAADIMDHRRDLMVVKRVAIDVLNNKLTAYRKTNNTL